MGVSVLQLTASAYLPRVDDVRIDGVALAFALMTSIVASVALGVLASMPDRATRLSSRVGTTVGTTAATRRTRKAFVIAEICLSFALLVCAGLLSRSLVRLQETTLGVDTDRLLTVRLLLTGDRYDDDGNVLSFYDDLLTRLRALPGVTSADMSSMIPPEIGGFSENFTIEGQSGEASPIVSLPIVGTRYFETMGVKLLRGRTFTNADTPTSPPVVIISQTMARQCFPDEDPIGKRLKQGGPERPNAIWREIVGVVSDVQYRRVDSPLEAVYYEPHAQLPLNGMYLVIRTALPTEILTRAVREQLHQIDRTLPVPEAATLDSLVSGSVAPTRFRTIVVAGFAATAALLALIGIYGVIAYSVLERSKEIGIRLALGAPRMLIVRLVLAECGLRLAAGLGLGVPIAMICANLLASFLFGVTPWDAATFGMVSIALVCCGLLASALPARRAARVDPLAMLR